VQQCHRNKYYTYLLEKHHNSFNYSQIISLFLLLHLLCTKELYTLVHSWIKDIFFLEVVRIVCIVIVISIDDTTSRFILTLFDS